MKFSRFSPFYLFVLSLGANAQSTNTSQELPIVEVVGKAEHLIGKARTSSQGQTSAQELAERPFLRRGELLESVPGVIITQHSGDGKANQYFVRGFNLDHGTDFSIFMDGQPVNFITHAHGQGYADLNPIIPELVESIDYWKGPFFAELGDLSTAGAAKFRFFDMLPSGIASFTIGEDNFYRGLVADTIDLSSGDGGKGGLSVRSCLTYALEYNYYDGPWTMKSDSERANGFLKYFREAGQDKFSLTAMAYTGDWNSTDQIPKRAIDDGTLSRFGNIDPTLGGNSNRYSLMAAWDREHTNGRTHVDAYAGYYDLDLFSNFTYVLGGGDQFEQKDERWFVGGEVRREWDFAEKNRLIVGVQTRNDFLNDIGLYNTTDRARTGTIRQDDVTVNTVGIFSSLDFHVNPWFRVQPGIRADFFHFDVNSDNPVNSGSDNDAIISPKLNLVFGPWNETEFYVSGGYGFHSNDARGVNLGVDGVDPLVRTYGGEIGVRTEALENVVSTLSFFYLHSDSELLYVGDAGTSEAGPATERYGVEWATYWRPTEWLMADNEVTLSEGKLKGVGGDDKIPGAVPFVWSAGITIGKQEGFFGTLRSRYFSPRPLIEDGSEESRASLQVNTRIGYRKNDWEVSLDCLNLLDRKDNDIEYFYESLMPGEAAGTGPNGGHEDIHLHPSEPRTFRVTFTKRF
ncbi:TonB-dependent receptor plug domain-containing protein [Luteolibacter sp. SL250]|uniref:TonB-dependent receptor n=1 Tax=Luteolibacter sp. SL250 TaxID=2995170 RepID=UPI00226DD90C|nr:TonB-dependent receptor [Luteolibacter sp. SL250]WAC18091.1 TonB-dependent receptor plug domain-containing protein [Luteolibacter sp. SL250]